MGSSTSKTARAAASTTRRYPTRVPSATTRAQGPPPAPPARPGPRGSEQAPAPQTEMVDPDARDPALASRLNSIGAVQPNPHFSPSSFSNLDPQRNPGHDFPDDMMQPPSPSAFPDPRDNPALRLLEARQRIQEEAEREVEKMGRRGFEGRHFTDAGTIQLALMRKKRGESNARIEDAFGLKRGRLAVLANGIVETVQ